MSVHIEPWPGTISNRLLIYGLFGYGRRLVTISGDQFNCYIN